MIENLKVLKKKTGGFTLIELLVVISIIAILSGVIILNSSDARAKARNAKRKSDLNTIASALESYYADYNAYPNGEGFVIWSKIGDGDYDNNMYRVPNLATSLNATATGGARHIWLWELADKGYINKTPKDPINLGANVSAFKFFTAGYPGLVYTYLNDIPFQDPGCGCTDEDYLGIGEGRNYFCFGGGTVGLDDLGTPHAQRYKLIVATERGLVDLDFARDGGNLNSYIPKGRCGNAVFIDTIQLGPGGDPMVINECVGAFYEVFSPGAARWPEDSDPDDGSLYGFTGQQVSDLWGGTACEF